MDSGQSWLTVIGCFMVHLIAIGIILSQGILLVELKEDFGTEHTSLIAQIPGIASALTALFGK